MKNKLSKGLSLSANPKCLIKGIFSAATDVFTSFFRKNDILKNNKLNSDSTDSPRTGEVLNNITFKGLDVVRQYAALLKQRVQTGTRARKALVVPRQANPLGRSMIEMLGVLAIIAVLLVGGIAGYSKAMMMWKIDKAINQYTHIIQGMLENQMSLRSLPHQHIGPLLQEMGIIPETWTINGLDIHDNIGNNLRVYTNHGNEKTMTFGVIIGGGNTNIYHKNNESQQICTAILRDFVQPLHAAVYFAFLYQNGVHYMSWRGDNTFVSTHNTKTDKYIKDMTPAEISEACQMCKDNGENACFILMYF